MTSSNAATRPRAGEETLMLILARLARKGAHLVALTEAEPLAYALVGPPRRPQRRQRTAETADRYEAAIVAEALQRGYLVGIANEGQGLRLSEAGAIAIARGSSRRVSPQPAGPPGARAPAPRVPARRVISESTIGRLRRTRGPDGAPLLSSAEAEAAERLAADFEKGRMGPRVTASYDPSAISDKRRHGAGPFGPDVAEARAMAQHRVRKALQAAGGELANILLDVCCLDRRLEDVERSRGWPQRSGRLVLRIALRALADHYGMSSAENPGPRRTRQWTSADFNPTLDTWFGSAPATRPGA